MGRALPRPFSARLNDEELAGVDMVTVDVSGCVPTWLSSDHHPVDRDGLSVLRICGTQLERVLPLLSDEEERRFYERVSELSRQHIAEAAASATVKL